MTDIEIFENNLSHFKIVSRQGDKAQCICPAHSDNKASLTITKGDKGTLFHCHAGCSIEDILTAAGVEKESIFYERQMPIVSKNQYWLEHNATRYDYHRLDTLQYDCTKWRKPNKSFEWGIYQDNKYTRSTKEQPVNRHVLSVFCNGRIKALKEAINNGMLICYAEGEKDAITLCKNGYIAFTFGGVHTFKDEILPYLKGGNFLVFADNDKQGIADAQRIVSKLKTIGKAKMIVLSDIPKGDISDYMQTHTKEELQEIINATMQQAEELQQDVKNKAVSETVDIVEVLEKLQASSKYETNDKGFGSLFADVFKDKHRYNTDRKTFMFYDGKKWVDDRESMRAKNSAKELSDALMIYAINCSMPEKEKMEYKKQILALSSMRKRHTMIDDSKDIYYFQNADLDKDDYILNVSNGTLDLTGIEPKFMKHSADMLLSKMCNVEYRPNAKCEAWLKFLDDVMQGDSEKIRFLQKIAGLSLTGNTQEETMFILHGSTTRNGKSTFVETLIYLLGDYALTMQPESLAAKHNSDSRQANGDIARLDGCRLCNASEPPKRMLFNTALLKSLLGRDSITARHLHEREFSFIPKFKLLMNTNYLPTITDDTVFSSNRINVISFDRHFEPHEQDKTLKQKLRSESELSGILNWCIEGLRLYRIEGLKPPAAVQNATATYRTDSDKVGNFLNECMVKSDKNTKAKDVYDEYEKWCNENGYGVENKGNFFAELKSKNILKPSGTVKGKTVPNIVKGYVFAEYEFTSIESSSETPFS